MNTGTTAALVGSAETCSAKPTRLMSLDALRGFDMFWIVGAEGLVAGLRELSDASPIRALANQLEHVAWAGFHFEDLIFPMFVFIVGVSLVFSLSKTIEQHGRRAAVGHVVRRSALLYLLGVLYYGGFSTPFEQIRLLGVLQRIAIVYLFAALIFCFFAWRGRLAWCIGILIGYWLLMTFVPVPGGTAGNLAEGQNLANWIDKQFLPLRKWDGDHDPEGLLSTLPAIANCLIGVFAGMLLRNQKQSNRTQVLWLAVAGALLLSMGWLWSIEFPVIKKLWTSSFVLVACGYSCLLLAAFHLVIEGWGWRRWALPLVWIGANPITIYLIDRFVDIPKLAELFVGGDLNELVLGRYGALGVALVGIAIIFGIARFLYQRKIFLRF